MISNHKEKKLKGEIAIVTGSDSGIGQATAIAFAREGADVVITYLEDKEGAEHTQKMVAEAGQQSLLMQLDQTQPGEIETLFKQTEETLGTPTILINNAGYDFLFAI